MAISNIFSLFVTMFKHRFQTSGDEVQKTKRFFCWNKLISKKLFQILPRHHGLEITKESLRPIFPDFVILLFSCFNHYFQTQFLNIWRWICKKQKFLLVTYQFKEASLSFYPASMVWRIWNNICSLFFRI